MNWKKLKNKVRMELTIINVYFIILLILLTFRYRFIESLADFFIYASTIILVIHIWWGAFFIINHLRLKETPTLLFLNIVMLIILFFEPFVLGNMAIWALFFSIFFTLVIAEYFILYKMTSNYIIKEYIKKKVRYGITAPFLFLLLYALLLISKSYPYILVLSIITFLGQIFFALFLFKIKKVYRII